MDIICLVSGIPIKKRGKEKKKWRRSGRYSEEEEEDVLRTLFYEIFVKIFYEKRKRKKQILMLVFIYFIWKWYKFFLKIVH